MFKYMLLGKRGRLIGTFKFHFGVRLNANVDLDSLAMDWARKRLELKKSEVTAEAFRSRRVMLVRVFLQYGVLESHRAILFPPLNLRTVTLNELKGYGRIHPRPFLDRETGQALPYLELTSDLSVIGSDGRTVQAVAGDFITRTIPRRGSESYIFSHVPRVKAESLISMRRGQRF